mmetsp:Transcript_477/g.954  ORF Transcript_477/g.954 Transcript_477/m.954 type:complete len:590 (+) Transcript_477:126-1895(+)
MMARHFSLQSYTHNFRYHLPLRQKLPCYIWAGFVSFFVFFQRQLISTTPNEINLFIVIDNSPNFADITDAPNEEPILLRTNTDRSSLSLPNRIDVAGKDNGSDRRTALATEIQSIRHFPREGMIVVQFKQTSDLDQAGGVNSVGSDGMSQSHSRLCKDPFLAGRLSGPFLSHNFQWEKHFLDLDVNKNGNGGHVKNETTKTVDKMIWRYDTPEPGQYFVEILGILCNDVGLHVNNGIFKNVCLEDSESLRITHGNASIHVVHNHPLDKRRKGYWKWENSRSSFDGNPNVDATIMPLFTRYQPVECRDVDSNFCNDRVSTERFRPYEFYFLDNNDDDDGIMIPNNHTQQQRQMQQYHHHYHQERQYQTLLSTNDKELRVMQKLRSTTKEKIKLCFVGASHSRKMTQAFNKLFVDSRTADIIEAYLLDVKFPRSVDADFIRGNILHWSCTKTIIAIGQWAASASKNEKYSHIPPISFPDFREEYRNMMKALNDLNVSGVHLRSIHLNPLGDLRFKCPAEDYRHPSVLEVYNEIIRNLTELEEFKNISFIDTDFIIGPMWDSSPDFCHFPPEGEIARAEALHILETVLFGSS